MAASAVAGGGVTVCVAALATLVSVGARRAVSSSVSVVPVGRRVAVGNVAAGSFTVPSGVLSTISPDFSVPTTCAGSCPVAGRAVIASV